MTDAKFVAILCNEARSAVIAHRRHYAEQPERHRGCLWCEDGRLSHWLTDARNFYCDDGLIDRVDELYARAYPQGKDMPVESYDWPRTRLP